jgi:hypothetical protein
MTSSNTRSTLAVEEHSTYSTAPTSLASSTPLIEVINFGCWTVGNSSSRRSIFVPTRIIGTLDFAFLISGIHNEATFENETLLSTANSSKTTSADEIRVFRAAGVLPQSLILKFTETPSYSKILSNFAAFLDF